jgi:hypothetical protein
MAPFLDLTLDSTKLPFARTLALPEPHLMAMPVSPRLRSLGVPGSRMSPSRVKRGSSMLCLLAMSMSPKQCFQVTLDFLAPDFLEMRGSMT